MLLQHDCQQVATVLMVQQLTFLTMLLTIQGAAQHC